MNKSILIFILLFAASILFIWMPDIHYKSIEPMIIRSIICLPLYIVSIILIYNTTKLKLK